MQYRRKTYSLTKMRAAEVAVALSILTSGSGCLMGRGEGGPAGPDSADLDGGPVGLREDSLWAWPGTTLVPNGTIAVCFNPLRRNADGTYSSVASNDPAIVRMSRLIQTSVEAAFETIPNAQIDFQGWGVCTNPVSGTSLGQIRVQLVTNTSGACFRRCTSTGKVWSEVDGPECGGGAGYSATKEMLISIAPDSYGDVASATATILHEFGHALGFDHEIGRDDSPQTYVSSENCPAKVAGTTISGVTVYDPMSILNATYCHWTPALSSLDRLGLEITYPRVFSHGIVLRNHTGFITSSGVTIRHDNSDVFVSDWTDRGASVKAFEADGGTMTWISPVSANNWNIGHGLSFPVWPSTASHVTGYFYDYAGRRHDLVGLGVTRDTGLHTALVLASAGL